MVLTVCRSITARGPAGHASSGQLPRMIGALAAGDATAWRKVMPRQAIIAHVGIHHRLLLRTDEGPLEILEFLTRQNEDVALKRLRS
jgi:hypothetical protein